MVMTETALHTCFANNVWTLRSAMKCCRDKLTACRLSNLLLRCRKENRAHNSQLVHSLVDSTGVRSTESSRTQNKRKVELRIVPLSHASACRSPASALRDLFRQNVHGHATHACGLPGSLCLRFSTCVPTHLCHASALDREVTASSEFTKCVAVT